MKAVITESIQGVFNQVDLMLDSSRDYTWFVDHPNYIPDYAVLHQMGVRMRDRYINGCTYAMGNSAWYRWVWPRLMAPVQRLLLEAPVATRNPAYDRIFIEAINTVCYDRRRALPHLSYTALFDLFSQCADQYYRLSYGIDDVYAADKQVQSRMAYDCYQSIHPYVKQGKRTFKQLICMAATANWMDSLEMQWKSKTEALCHQYAQHTVPVSKLIGCESVISQLQMTTPGKTLLYECDNHGEVWFDCLLVEWLLDHGCSVIMTGKEKPVVNDVTAHELAVIIDQIPALSAAMTTGKLQVISTGSCMTGRSIYTISNAYKKAYASADEIWVKGQGNFASTPMAHWRWGRLHWYQYKKPVVFLMVVKANLIQSSLSLLGMNRPKGAILIHRYE